MTSSDSKASAARLRAFAHEDASAGHPAPTVLLVEDDGLYARVVVETLARLTPEIQVRIASGVREAVELLSRQRVDALVLDRTLPDGDGLAVVRGAHAGAGDVPFVLLTNDDSARGAVEALHAGAVDYVVKREDALERTAELLRSMIAPKPVVTSAAGPALVGESRAMQVLRAEVRRYAPGGSCVLVVGETGVGKELVARALHAASERSGGPFVAINCGALPEPLFEAELFGHARGAYTGAHGERSGLIEHARRGTLFLDEVEDLPLAAQGKLLRLIQEREYRPLGTVHARSADVRIVAATNRDLPRMVEEGRFRRDLYYRLDVLRIVVPPLRERLEDLLSLISHLVARRAGSVAASSTQPVGPLPEELRALAQHAWPGNVRELENVVERARAVASVIGWRAGWASALRQLEAPLFARPDSPGEELEDPSAGEDRAALESLLARHRWRRASAARELGISRVTLWRRMRRLGLAAER